MTSGLPAGTPEPPRPRGEHGPPALADRGGATGAVSLLRRLPPWAAPVAVGGVVLTGLTLLATLDDDTRGLLAPRCPFRLLTGLDCPGCGGTRAVVALLRGDPLLALDHNVITVVALPLLALAWVGWLLARLGRRSAPPTVPPAVGITIAVVFTAFMVLRNLPWLPFAWLGSTPLG